jgi:invasion protein IalB
LKDNKEKVLNIHQTIQASQTDSTVTLQKIKPQTYNNNSKSRLPPLNPVVAQGVAMIIDQSKQSKINSIPSGKKRKMRN